MILYIYFPKKSKLCMHQVPFKMNNKIKHYFKKIGWEIHETNLRLSYTDMFATTIEKIKSLFKSIDA